MKKFFEALKGFYFKKTDYTIGELIYINSTMFIAN